MAVSNKLPLRQIHHLHLLSHNVFPNVRPDAFHVLVYPFGKSFFGENCMMYTFGQDHKNLRCAPYPPRSLSQGSSHLHFNPATHYSRARKIVPRSLRMLCRDMNLETSQTVFVGPYLSEEDSNRFNVDYIHFNIGLIKLPINLPGLAFRKARLARGKLVLTPAR